MLVAATNVPAANMGLEENLRRGKLQPSMQHDPAACAGWHHVCGTIAAVSMQTGSDRGGRFDVWQGTMTLHLLNPPMLAVLNT